MPIKINKKSIIIIVVALVLVGAIALGYLYNKKQEANNAKQTAQKAIDFINKNLLSGGTTASLDGATSSNGVLKIGLKIGDQSYTSYVTKDGKLFFPEGYEMKDVTTTAEVTPETSASVGNFMTKDEEICKEDGKPIVYFFGSNTCPHCLWEHPILTKVMKNFEGLVSFHNNMDSQTDMEIFSKYSDGGIPTLVFGCKYYRLGSGESEGEEAETKNLTAMLCKLTDNKPSEICSGVQDLVNQIK